MKAYLSTKEAAEYISFSESFLEHFRAHTGGPAFIRVGKTIRYKIEALENWMQARAQS